MTGATTAAVDVPGLVRRVLGADAVAERPERWATREVVPDAVALPASADEAAELLGAATSEGVRVRVAGRGTWLGGGDRSGPAPLVVSTLRMDRILQYEPADMTLTAGAGIGLDALSVATGEHGQWLAADPPGADDGTLGATLATASSGFLKTKYGAVRDLVLGLTLVTGDGRVLRLGGRVVKNVAGFDLVRLAVGSRGTLGVITEATVRVHPRPRGVARLRARGERMEELTAACGTVAGMPVVPARLELRETPDGNGGREANLAVTLHGAEASVEAEADRIRREVPDLERVDEELPLPHPARDPDLVVRLREPRRGIHDLVAVARTLGRLEGRMNVLDHQPVVFRGDPLTGSIRIVVPNVRSDGTWAGQWRERLEDLRRTMIARGGGLTVESAPPAIMEGLTAHAPAEGAEAGLMRRVRDHFDPEGILAPARLDLGGAGAPERPGRNRDTGAGVEWE